MASSFMNRTLLWHRIGIGIAQIHSEGLIHSEVNLLNIRSTYPRIVNFQYLCERCELPKY